MAKLNMICSRFYYRQPKAPSRITAPVLPFGGIAGRGIIVDRPDQAPIITTNSNRKFIYRL
jgi:hypothetical protein